MRTPTNGHRTDEITSEIIKRAECPPKVASFVQRIVQRLISDLRTAPERFSGIQKKNVAFAEKLRKEITKLEYTLKSAPDPFVLSILFEERFWQLWWNRQNTPIAINANTKQYIAQERAHQNHFAAILDRLRARCDEIVNLKPGEHGGIKYQQRHAAMASFAALEAVAQLTGTELQLTVSPTSTFVEIACLFHEAATGEYVANLLVACKALKAELDAKK
jgi:hypothetical protein